MSFQFVHVTPDNTEHDEDTRRRIRSQAMRDFRRRQRDEEEPIPAASPPTSSSPQKSSASGSRQVSRRRKGSTQSLPTHLESLPQSTQLFASDELLSIDDLRPRGGKRPGMPKAALSDDPAIKSRVLRRRTEGRAKHGVFGSFSVNLSRAGDQRPSQPGEADPLQSTDQLQHMLSICDAYQLWLMRSTVPALETVQTSDPWDSQTARMLLFALCLQSIGHLEALHPGQSIADEHLLKSKALELINKRLNCPTMAVEDKTIGALASLTSYELSRGSREATIHLSGLSEIIKLRGGTRSIADRGGLSMFLEMLDLIHAVYFNSSPTYTNADASRESPPRQHPSLDPRVLWTLDEPTLGETSDTIMAHSEQAGNEMLPDTLPPGVTLSPLESEVHNWHRFLAQSAQRMNPSFEGAVEYVCDLAAQLHLASTSPVAPHPARLQALTEKLFSTMSSLPDDAWDAFHELHLRILLTALNTAGNHSEKSWYHAHLTRRLYHTEQADWSAMKAVMLHFIDMESGMRHARSQVLKALANGVEIVVHPSEPP